MGLAVAQINFLVVTVLASTLNAGSLAIFNLANNIQSVPLGLFGISFAVAAFPTLASSWSTNNKKDFIHHFSKTFNNIIFFIIPFSAVFIVLRAQIVRIILGAGKFDWEDTILTFQALGIFSLSLFAQSIIPLLARTFYAIHDTKTPFFVGIFSEAANLLLALTLIKSYGILGLVWAFSISTVLNMFLLLIILRHKVGKLQEERIISSAWKIIIATLIMSTGMQITKYEISYIIDMRTFLGVFIQMGTSLLVGGLIFWVVGKLLKIKEFDEFICLVKKKTLGLRTLSEDKRDEVGGIIN
jgi:putative peptidoglycan lipid II flippase